MKIKSVAIFLFVLILLSSASVKDIIIDETGFKQIRIGRTKISTIKKRYPTAKKKKSFRHALFRGKQFRYGVTFFQEVLETPNGISFYFYYEKDTKKPIKLNRIDFKYPAKVITNKGIKLGKSTFEEINEKYGLTETYYTEQEAIKDYDQIQFIANYKTDQDSTDKNLIVSSISLSND